jgi:hypothetical protein
MESSPDKPWRVTAFGRDGGQTSLDCTSEDDAQLTLRGFLFDTTAERARVEEWEDGRWRPHETLTKQDLL